jgi:hypothetical protein
VIDQQTENSHNNKIANDQAKAIQEGKCGAVKEDRYHFFAAICQRPIGHVGNHGGMGCEWGQAEAKP